MVALLRLLEKTPRAIIFYNFDYELEILKSLYYGEDVAVAEWNGHRHDDITETDKWVYLIAEGGIYFAGTIAAPAHI